MSDDWSLEPFKFSDSPPEPEETPPEERQEKPRKPEKVRKEKPAND